MKKNLENALLCLLRDTSYYKEATQNLENTGSKTDNVEVVDFCSYNALDKAISFAAVQLAEQDYIKQRKLVKIAK
jgi:hypothetical protein